MAMRVRTNPFKKMILPAMILPSGWKCKIIADGELKVSRLKRFFLRT